MSKALEGIRVLEPGPVAVIPHDDERVARERGVVPCGKGRNIDAFNRIRCQIEKGEM